MFTLQKLLRLPHKTMLRKLVLILQKTETEIEEGRPIDLVVLEAILTGVRDRVPEKASLLIEKIHVTEDLSVLRRYFNTIRFEILSSLGSLPSEWDFTLPSSGLLDESKRIVFPISVFLEDIRSPYNVGSIFRTADAFGVSKIYLTGYTGTPANPIHKKKIGKVALGAEEWVPWEYARSASIIIKKLKTQGVQIIGLENNIGKSINIKKFKPKFPIALILGEETTGINKSLIKQCDKLVEIPMLGQKESLNVSVAFGVATYVLVNPK